MSVRAQLLAASLSGILGPVSCAAVTSLGNHRDSTSPFEGETFARLHEMFVRTTPLATPTAVPQRPVPFRRQPQVVGCGSTDVDPDFSAEPLLRVAKEVRIVPFYEKGVIQGFKLYNVRPDTFLARSGFATGDVVKSVNGLPTKSPEGVMQAARLLRDEKSLEVVIARLGREQAIRVVIP